MKVTFVWILNMCIYVHVFVSVTVPAYIILLMQCFLLNLLFISFPNDFIKNLKPETRFSIALKPSRSSQQAYALKFSLLAIAQSKACFSHRFCLCNK